MRTTCLVHVFESVDHRAPSAWLRLLGSARRWGFESGENPGGAPLDFQEFRPLPPPSATPIRNLSRPSPASTSSRREAEVGPLKKRQWRFVVLRLLWLLRAASRTPGWCLPGPCRGAAPAGVVAAQGFCWRRAGCRTWRLLRVGGGR